MAAMAHSHPVFATFFKTLQLADFYDSEDIFSIQAGAPGKPVIQLFFDSYIHEPGT
jgi:hypothetical protein